MYFCSLYYMKSVLNSTKSVDLYKMPCYAAFDLGLLCLPKDSKIFLTFIKLPIVIKLFVLSILSGRFTQGLL